MQENFIGRYVGHFLLEDLINRGGMSAVYRGRHSQTGQVVAVKVLPAYFAHDPQFLRRFQREARAVAILDHPHIVRVLSTGKTDSLPYIIMEYVGGGTLKDLLEQGRLPLDRAARLIGQIADALHYAHEHGVVHRDVKPSNVLLASPDLAKLSDFGIAKLAEEGTTLMTALTATGIGVGTAAYMAPEQAIEAASADARADIYSLGVMLFQIVAGRLPYTADTPMGLLAQHIYEPVPSIHRDAPEASDAIERVLLKAMAKDPAARFQSALDLSQAFADAVANRPVAIDLPSDLEPLPDEQTAVLDDSAPLDDDATRLDAGVDVGPPTAVESEMEDISDLNLRLKPQHRPAFRAALTAYDRGDLDTAGYLLHNLLRVDDQVAEAWLLLSFVEQEFQDQYQCAENALAVAPDLEDARLRFEQLQAQRLPVSIGKARSRIPAVQAAHDAVMDAYFPPSELEAVDPLDNPDQCPYCGVVNEKRRNTCKSCGQSMMRSMPPLKAPVQALRLVYTLHFGVLLMLVFQLVPPLLWIWYLGLQEPSRAKMFIDDVLATRAATLVLGNFTEVLTPSLFQFLVTVGLVRLGILVAGGIGLRMRWSWAYYLTMVAFVIEGVWAIIAVGLGWTGVVIAGLAILLAFAGLMGLASASVNFTVNTERYLVLPEGRLHSGVALLKLGRDYQRKGMWAMAVAQYRAAVAAAPNRAEHYKALGIGYNKLGRIDRALPVFDQALRLDPTDREVSIMLKRIKRDMEAAGGPVGPKTAGGAPGAAPTPTPPAAARSTAGRSKTDRSQTDPVRHSSGPPRGTH